MSKQRFKKRSPDPDFDLDEYIEEKAAGEQPLPEQEFESESSYKIRNTLVIAGLVIFSFLWYFDWSPVNAYNYFFAGESSPAGIEATAPIAEFQTDNFDFDFDFDFDFSEFENLPEASSLNMSFTEYMAKLNELGYLNDNFGSSSVSRLYENNVPIEYIDGFGKGGVIDNFGSTSISRLFNNRVPLEYVLGFEEAGILDNFGSTSISRLHSNQVPLEYIINFKQAGVLDDFGSTSISRLYNNKVPIKYIYELNQAGFLDNFGSTSISRLYENGVPIEFLRTLNDQGLLDNMSSSSIVDAYQIDGN